MTKNNFQIIDSHSEWIEFRKFRLKCLRIEPETLGISYEDEKSNLQEYYTDLLEKANGHDEWLLFVKYDNKIIGMINAIREAEDKIKILYIFVHPKYRNKGVGTILMNTLIEKINNKNIKIIVKVSTTLIGPIKLYTKFNFKKYDILPKGISIDDKSYDCLLMYR